MAESNLHRALSAGQDEYFDFTCDSCLLENRHEEAKGHCRNCAQNICNDCIKSHNKLAGLRSHILENQPKIMKGKGLKTYKNDDNPFIDYCITHPGEFTKFYCNVHQTMTCGDCLTQNHLTCDVSCIQDISRDIGNSEDLAKLQTDLRKLEETLTKYKANTERIHTDFTEAYTNIVKEIKQWRNDIGHVLDDLEKQLLEKAASLKTDTVTSLTNNLSSCDDLITETNKLLSDLDDKMKAGYYNSLYIAVRQNQESLARIQQEAKSIGEQCKSRPLFFCRHDDIVTLLSDQGLGHVSISPSANIRAKYEREINIKSKKDKKECYISSVTVLPDGRLCLCDFGNKSIKLVDTKLMKISEQLTLSARPLDATMISQGELAVIIKDDKNLKIVSISPSLRRSRTILVPDEYTSITYCDNKLLLTHTDGWLDICDMEGHRIKHIETNVDGTEIFSRPASISVNPNRSVVYVTDEDSHEVVCLTQNGDVLDVHRNQKLQIPGGSTVDDDGYVYVCSTGTHTVHQLTPNGQLVQVLLNQRDGLVCPLYISYIQGQLYISSSCSTPADANSIKVFRLDQKWYYFFLHI